MTAVAAIQMASGPNVNANLLEAGRLIGRAAGAGARLVVLPENFAVMGMAETDKVARHGIWLVGGTIPLVATAADKVRAACLLYDPSGRRIARYDKIHLFDVRVVDSGEQYTESQTIEPGTEPVVVDTPIGKIGLAVCYDLRFPELFRRLLDDGMELMVAPSAFTAITGRAHWETLLRARAIENLCYVVAGAQGGYHLNGRETHGDSMIVDPWGVILDRLPRGSGFVIAELDRKRLTSTRSNFPAIDHRRLHCK
jgi:deaminated glutathione amidase